MFVVIQNDPLVTPGLLTTCLDKLGVEWVLCRADLNNPIPEAAAAIILGGTMGANDEQQFPYLSRVKSALKRWLAEDIPLLGICLGAQLLAQAAGGQFRSASHGEHGVVQVEQTAAGETDLLFSELPAKMSVFQWHNDSFTIPPQAHHLAGSTACPGQAFRLGNAWGLQFHPEVDHKIVQRWCSLSPDSSSYLRQYLHRAEEITEKSGRILMNFILLATAKPLNNRQDNHQHSLYSHIL